jgi:hypothetical protein
VGITWRLGRRSNITQVIKVRMVSGCTTIWNSLLLLEVIFS